MAAYRIEATLMTLNDLQGYSPTESLFKCAADKIN